MIIARTADGRDTALLVDASGRLVLGAADSGVATSVWSAADASANAMTLSNGGLTVVSTTSAWQSVRGSVGHASGRYYVEFKCAVAATANASVIGLADTGFVVASYLSSTNYSAGYSNSGGTNIVSPAGFANNSSPSFVHTPALNDVYQLAVDLTAGNIWMGLNNSWYTLLAAERDPSTGSPAMINIVAPALGLNLFPAISVNGAASGTWTLQSTAANQKYAPPSGFTAWDGGTAPPPTSVWSSSDATAGGMALSNGGLTVASPGDGSWHTIRGSIGKSSGKLYIEFAGDASIANYLIFTGLADAAFPPSTNLGAATQSCGFWVNPYVSGGFIVNFSPGITPGTPNAVAALAVDFTAGNVWFAINNVWQQGNGPGVPDPATGAFPPYSFTPATVGVQFPGMSFGGPSCGVWTIKSTTASQKYAPPAGFSAWDGAGTHSPQALAYLARTVGGNEGGNGANIAALIDGLVSDGVWAKLDCLYVLAQQNATDALLNLVGTSYTLGNTAQAQQQPANFVAYQGLSVFPSGGLDTGFDPNATGIKYILYDASIGAWAYNATDGGGLMGGDGYAGGTTIYANFNMGGTLRANVNTGPFDITPPASIGFISGDRSGSATCYSYLNGVAVGSAPGGGTVPATHLYIGGSGTGGWQTAKTISAAHIGASLGAAGQLALYNRLRTYMTAIGVP